MNLKYVLNLAQFSNIIYKCSVEKRYLKKPFYFFYFRKNKTYLNSLIVSRSLLNYNAKFLSYLLRKYIKKIFKTILKVLIQCIGMIFMYQTIFPVPITIYPPPTAACFILCKLYMGHIYYQTPCYLGNIKEV